MGKMLEGHMGREREGEVRETSIHHLWFCDRDITDTSVANSKLSFQASKWRDGFTSNLI